MTELLNKAAHTPLARVRGLGSAKEGVHHWWMQRLTAVILVPLILWFVISFVGEVAGGSRATAIDWFESPVNSFLLLALMSAAFYHAKLGLQVVAEDYVHKKCLKIVVMTLIQVIFPLATLITWVAVLKLHIVGA
jgi:succinate dehydrogenase / fumarate reductase membrane anchor subunit